MQEIIVYLILAAVAILIIRHVYHQATGKTRDCNCDSCAMRGGECHCHDTQK
ncbi:MAG: FeoB-associated Cys-rich membrane protein [Bacteroidaceae bacterium]|nr:FeoB-associated Cys-rich membrane protein [Bacteroidaceae bacterium]